MEQRWNFPMFCMVFRNKTVTKTGKREVVEYLLSGVTQEEKLQHNITDQVASKYASGRTKIPKDIFNSFQTLGDDKLRQRVRACKFQPPRELLERLLDPAGEFAQILPDVIREKWSKYLADDDVEGLIADALLLAVECPDGIDATEEKRESEPGFAERAPVSEIEVTAKTAFNEGYSRFFTMDREPTGNQKTDLLRFMGLRNLEEERESADDGAAPEEKGMKTVEERSMDFTDIDSLNEVYNLLKAPDRPMELIKMDASGSFEWLKTHLPRMSLYDQAKKPVIVLAAFIGNGTPLQEIHQFFSDLLDHYHILWRPNLDVLRSNKRINAFGESERAICYTKQLTGSHKPLVRMLFWTDHFIKPADEQLREQKQGLDLAQHGAAWKLMNLPCNGPGLRSLLAEAMEFVTGYKICSAGLLSQHFSSHPMSVINKLITTLECGGFLKQKEDKAYSANPQYEVLVDRDQWEWLKQSV